MYETDRKEPVSYTHLDVYKRQGLRLRIAGDKHDLFPGICFLDNKFLDNFSE